MDISKIKLGEIIEGLKCPKCREKNQIRLVGIHPKDENSHELECQSCFLSERVIPTDMKFTYEESKEPKKKKEKKVEEDES